MYYYKREQGKICLLNTNKNPAYQGIVDTFNAYMVGGFSKKLCKIIEKFLCIELFNFIGGSGNSFA